MLHVFSTLPLDSPIFDIYTLWPLEEDRKRMWSISHSATPPLAPTSFTTALMCSAPTTMRTSCSSPSLRTVFFRSPTAPPFYRMYIWMSWSMLVMATPISLFRSMGVGSVVVISPVSVCISTSPFIFNIIMNA